MDKAFHGPFAPTVIPRARFSLGRGLVACFWAWVAVGTLASVRAEESTGAYQQALGSFNHRNYRHALSLLDRLPDDLSAVQRADACNLRGAIYLRQGRFDQARAAFAEASKSDPKLWAARYNGAEVSFRQKHYEASRREFERLLSQTSRVFQPEEHRFLDYKARLANLCAGRDQAAREFIDRHRHDPAPPLAWYYLNAALERQRGHAPQATQWLAQAEDKHVDANRQLYADSLEWLGNEAKPAVEDLRPTSAVANHRLGSRQPGAGEEIARRGNPEEPGRRERTDAGPSTTVAVVQLIPGDAAQVPDGKDAASVQASALRFGAPVPPEDRPARGSMPPDGPGLFPAAANPAAVSEADRPVVGVLAKPRRGRGSPAPSPAPSASPTPAPGEAPAVQPGKDASSPVVSATPVPAASATPEAATPEYTQKYEAAYVKYLEKDYPGTLDVLEEADKIQPRQPQTTTLRAQVFKQAYEAAYLAYRKADYPVSLNLLDVADRAQSNYPDALNLRGLVYAKQRVYDRAETMFKRAVTADPTLWAAKFNYAELPFNRGDYTTARGRFEDLLAETDAEKRPREAELTQYKVFLTLLLEGKSDQARSFMDHFNFSGATPAKYFCNAAMNFRAGTTDKAVGWIDSAKKEYPAQLVSIFLESFYRLGWMADPNAAGTGTAVAAASPAVEAAAPSVPPVPSATPAAPVAAAMVAGASPTPAAAASMTPAATASASPVLLAASSPSATVALEGADLPAQPPAGSVPPAAPVGTPAPLATPSSSPEPSVAPAGNVVPNEEAGEESATGSDILRLGIIAAVLLYGCWTSYRIISAAARRRTRRRAARAARLVAAGARETSS